MISFLSVNLFDGTKKKNKEIQLKLQVASSTLITELWSLEFFCLLNVAEWFTLCYNLINSGIDEYQFTVCIVINSAVIQEFLCLFYKKQCLFVCFASVFLHFFF